MVADALNLGVSQPVTEVGVPVVPALAPADLVVPMRVGRCQTPIVARPTVDRIPPLEVDQSVRTRTAPQRIGALREPVAEIVAWSTARHIPTSAGGQFIAGGDGWREPSILERDLQALPLVAEFVGECDRRERADPPDPKLSPAGDFDSPPTAPARSTLAGSAHRTGRG